MKFNRSAAVCAAILTHAGLCAVAQAQLLIPAVPISNPGNAPDPFTGFGAVAYRFDIAMFEVTNAQYTDFLNAKAQSDPFELWNPSMMSPTSGGIVRTGADGSYAYGTDGTRLNHPVVYVSFWDACRFANWLHNGQGQGDTETGAYTLTPEAIAANTVVRNPGARWAVTSEDEWYKAAYHQPTERGGPPGGYWLYPTSTDTISASQANFNNPIGGAMSGGSFAPNFWTVFDLAGNAFEWTEAIDGSNRATRGGSYLVPGIALRSDFRFPSAPSFESSFFGFRVVQLPTCPADYDGSGFVDSDDFVMFIDQFARGCTGPGQGAFGSDPLCTTSADFDRSGFVDSDDFVAFADAFQTPC